LLQEIKPLLKYYTTLVISPSLSCLNHALKRDMISVQIPEEDYHVGLEECKNHLHGRLSCSKEISLSLTWKFARNLKGLGGFSALGKLSLLARDFTSLLSPL